MIQIRPTRLGLVPANRAFFSADLSAAMRARTLEAMAAAGIDAVVPDESMTRRGCVETLEEAERVGRFFRERDVQGIVVGAMNFGDEQGVALCVRAAGLHLPVFAFGGQEEGVLTPRMERRDSFCGLISICDVLRQIGARYSVPREPIGYPEDPGFRKDLADFAAVCRVVSGLRRARIGQVGARPDPFWTCRYDEKALERAGVSVTVMDLSEAIERAQKIADGDARVRAVLEAMARDLDRGHANETVLVKMAKFEVVLREFIAERRLDALAIQCWTSLQRNFGVCSCTGMARLGDDGVPSACEADVVGALSMLALQLASGGAAALADWNNLHPEDAEVVNLWHCGVFPPSFAAERPAIKANDNMIKLMPFEISIGTLQARMQAGPVTLTRLAQCDDGGLKAVIAEGEVVDVDGTTYGAYGWTRVPGLPELYRDVVLEHFPHHVALTRGRVGNVIYEALGKYLGVRPFHHNQRSPGAYAPGRPF
jgi:L-fucose isomerase-like protein